MSKNQIKNVIKSVKHSKDDKTILREYENVVNMFNNLVKLGLAKKNESIIARNSCNLKFEIL